MTDEFLIHFDWITDMLNNNPIGDFCAAGTGEHAILSAFKEGWGTRDTGRLLRGLTAAYGEKAGEVVERYIASILRRSWAKKGKKKRTRERRSRTSSAFSGTL